MDKNLKTVVTKFSVPFIVVLIIGFYAPVVYCTDNLNDISLLTAKINEDIITNANQLVSLVETTTDCTKDGLWTLGNSKPNVILLSEAKTYTSNKKILWVKLYEHSCSGDWNRSTEYFFRTDGSLAQVKSELATFLATDNNNTKLNGTIVEIQTSFDSLGRVLDNKQQAWDMTKKQKLDNVVYSPNNNPVRFAKPQDFPFVNLLK